MIQYIQKLPIISKVLTVMAICCIFICIGIICWYSNIDTALLDSVGYYDKGMHFHYYYGLEKPVSCMLYIILLGLILIMIRIVVGGIEINNERKASAVFISFIICVFLFAILFHNLFSLKIGHIIVSEDRFYIIENIIVKSNFEEYPYSCLDSYSFQAQGKEIYFCRVENNENYSKWERKFLIGRYSNNVYKLLNELDNRTEYKYQITTKFNQSK